MLESETFNLVTHTVSFTAGAHGRLTGTTCFTAEQFRVRPGRVSAEWLASPALDGLETPDPSNVHEVHQGAPPAPQPVAAQAIRALIEKA